MKKIVYCAAALSVFAAMSCNKTEQPSTEPARPAGPAEKYLVEVSVPAAEYGVKSTTPFAEEDLVNVQVFAFDSDGNLDGSASSVAGSGDPTGPYTLECTAMGTHTVVAVANAAAMTGISTLSDLQGKVARLEENSAEAMIMVGEDSFEVTGGTKVSKSVTVKRLLARVSIEKIVCDFASETYAAADFVVKGIYLTNVAGDAAYINGSYSPTVWYNQMGNQNAQPDFLYSGALNETVTETAAYTTPHYFYCCPNQTDTDTYDKTWAPRHTRLVVEATLAGNTFYYPMTLPQIESNHTYTVTQLKITKPGYLTPEAGPDSGTADMSAEFTIVVSDWEEGSSGEYTI